jgi:hypothetical protein|tara:strand:- start:746 stop:979 length:234 start_codon:yes stop_codon:yes gene_type:complete
MTLGPNKKPLQRKYGTRIYWKSYAKGILAQKKPWLSENKCALIGLGAALRDQDPEAIRLEEALQEQKKYCKRYDQIK